MDNALYWEAIAKWQRDEIIKKCSSFKEEDDEVLALNEIIARKDALLEYGCTQIELAEKTVKELLAENKRLRDRLDKLDGHN